LHAGKISYGPLSATGSLSEVERRHLFEQFTNIAAEDVVLLHYVANQVRRHKVLSTIASVSIACKNKFESLVNDPDFKQKCDDALRDPRSTEGKRLHRKISSMLSQSGKHIPWSLAERANTKGLMFAMRDRHGMPSLFVTFAIDDTRDIQRIRISVRILEPNGFPCFGGTSEDECEAVREMLSAMERGGKLEVDGKEVADFSRSSLSRSVVKNPIAASKAYHNMLRAFTHAMGLSNGNKRTIPIFASDPKDGSLKLSDEALKRGNVDGMFGIPFAGVGVTECSKRKALHAHWLTWLASSPEPLARYASDINVWKEIAAAMESQIVGSVGLEVHLLHGLKKVMHVQGPRSSFAQSLSLSRINDKAGMQTDEVEPSAVSPSTAATYSAAAIAVEHNHCAITTNDHGCCFSCHNSNSGQAGCRYCKKSGHPVSETAFVQLNDPEKVLETAELHGDGNPIFCPSVAGEEQCGCTAQYPGIDDEAEAVRGNTYTPMTITKPSEPPAFPSGADTVYVCLFCVI
jgi:hypothetical protein